MNPKRMINPVRPYAWGSRHFIAALQDRPVPTASPEAELWLGAHPAAPSAVVSLPAETPEERRTPPPTLDRWIAENRADTLGADVAARFGGELPFLMKILAAAQPLSLQAHPSRAEAERGFDAEEAAHVPMDAPERSYKDRHHKPELIVALTPFVALCGFRPVVETRRLLAALGVDALGPCQRLLDREPPEEALRAVFQYLLALPAIEQRDLTDAVRRGISRRGESSAVSAAEHATELGWAERLADIYPGDVGVVGALFLNLVHLAPDEGLYLPAGNLHAYLEGAGVEIMANSDNVLRGGLTPKPIHVPELLRILRFEEARPIPLRPTPIDAGEAVFDTPADEFQLSRLRLGAGRPALERVPLGPEVLLVTDGEVELGWGSDAVRLARGGSVFVPSSSPPYRLSGNGNVYRARVPAAP